MAFNIQHPKGSQIVGEQCFGSRYKVLLLPALVLGQYEIGFNIFSGGVFLNILLSALCK